MEELKQVPSAPPQVPIPPTAAQTLPPKNKKRPLDSNAYAQNFKMRAVLKDLRPHFIEVLKTADFRNSKAAHEIQEGIKLILDLQKQMWPAETPCVEKPKNLADCQASSTGNQDRQVIQEPHRDVKLGDKSSDSHYLSNTAAEKPDALLSGAYIVGGSAFGWNFITFTGGEPVYYGVTKEVYREKNPIVSSSEF